MAKNLVSMELPKAPEQDAEMVKPAPTDSVHDKYPYGLRISLRKEEIAKLGLDVKSFAVDDPVEIPAKGVIVRVSQSSSEMTGQGKDVDENIEIQITEMNIIPEGNFESSFEEAVEEND